MRLLALGLLALLLLGGCGGGGGGGGGGATTGQLRISVDWPSRGRYVPPYAESIVGTVMVNGSPRTATLNRSGSQGYTGTVLFSSGFAPGDHSLTVKAYSQPNGGGSSVAEATLTVMIVAGQTTTAAVSANLQSTIDHLEIDGQPLSVQVGRQLQLSGHAENAAQATLLIPAGAFTWSVMSGGSFGSVSSSGLFTALAQGTATVRMAETGAGKTVDAAVQVTGLSQGPLEPNRIYYGVLSGSGVQLSHMSPSGTGNTAWVFLPEGIASAALNPAGSKWAFLYTSDPTGPDPRYDLYTNATPTIAGATRRTTANYITPGSVQFTGDGSQIVYTASLAEDEFGLYKIGASAGPPTRLLDAEQAQIHPATNKIVITRVLGGAGDIAVTDLSGSTPVPLASSTAEDWMAQWSKDGQRVVFSTDRNGLQFDIFSVGADDSGLQQVTSALEDEYGPSFSADGSEISFTVLSGEIGGYGVYKVSANGSGRQVLLLEPGITLSTYWSSTEGRSRSARMGPGLLSWVRSLIRKGR